MERPTRRRILAALLAAVLGTALVVALFDWNWIRGPLARYYSERSGREVTIGHLGVDLGFSLTPTVTLRDVHIPNASWGIDAPFVRAREVTLTFSLASLWRGRPVISRIGLADAEVTLERRADGLRNWRLREPDNREPGRTRVLTLEARRAQVVFINRDDDLAITARAEPLPAADAERGYDTRIAFEGRYRGAAFEGEALNAGLISFRDSGLAFPVRGHFVSRGARLEIDGTLTDVFDLGPMDLALRLRGPSLALLHPFVRMRPPPSRAFDLRARLRQRDGVYDFSALAGKVGATALEGEARFDRSGERPAVRAAIASPSADLVDLRALAGLRAGGDGAANGNAGGPRRLASAQPLNVEKLRGMDFDVKLSAPRVRSADLPLLESVRGEARLAHGLLELTDIAVGLAGGAVTGRVRLDARRDPPDLDAALALRGLRVERLVPALAHKTGSAAALRGRIELAGRGESLAAMLATAHGRLDAHIDGGRLSSLADAKLGLNFGRALGVLIRGDRPNAIRCARAAFEVRNALATARALVLDTEQTHVRGAGTIDLKRETLDLTLRPHTRDPGLLTRHADIRLQGGLRNVSVALQDAARAQGPAPSGCG